MYTQEKPYSFNAKKQKRIIENQDLKTILVNLNNQFEKLEQKLFCKVNTRENILKLIQLILIEVKKRTVKYTKTNHAKYNQY